MKKVFKNQKGIALIYILLILAIIIVGSILIVNIKKNNNSNDNKADTYSNNKILTARFK